MDEKDHSIRFINSNYDTLFRISDGGIVEVRFPDRAFSAKCEYLDDYHTLVGDTVFHICEFAEMVERQGGSVHPEPETTLDKAAWQLAHREYLLVERTDSGFRYELLTRQEELVLLPDDTVANFRNEVFERAAREYSGISEGELRVSDLVGLTELYIYGDQYSLTSYESVFGNEGAGSIDDLSDLKYFTHLEKLVLASQPLRTLETMPASPIEYLSLDFCPLISLQGIGSLQRLREINTDACPVRDLGNLGTCLELRRLCLMGANIADFSSLKPLIRLAEVELSNCGLNELGTLLGLSGLTDITFRECDLRGNFFRAFDRERIIVSLTLIDCKLNSTANLDDFKGLTTLSLARTGETLDWSQLANLPSLKTVHVDVSMKDTIQSVLSGTDVQVFVSE